ncbi:unnamed protein product [Thelazia callipaeda]|uniref:Kringle domain-containing protein n=1 Tax=Thelazia callipaeda TaxID=103827 RepID=A0A158RD32_THECL|nr:unnamed protein product [Thelazia callipaeda]
MIAALLLVCLFICSDISVALWNLTAFPWYCDKECYERIGKMDISHEGCLNRNATTEHVFQMFNIGSSTPICHKLSKSRQSICLKMIEGQYFLGTCNVNVTDHRIRCRKATDSMTWYRGLQSVTFSGKSCLRWDEVNSTFRFSDFSSYYGPSISHLSRTHSTGIHSIENYCRNPDSSSMGPWCFIVVCICLIKQPHFLKCPVVSDKGKIRREACFKQCEGYNYREFCLAKMLFPYMLPSFSPFDDAPTVETVSESVKDLSDIIDVLPVVRFHPRNRPMFVPTYFDDYIRNYPTDISTRTRCYQTGPRTRIAGPWIYSDPDESPSTASRYWLFDLLDEIGGDEMDRERVFRSDGGPRYTRWRPCFLACEDTNVPCWPTAQTDPSRGRFPYYGPRNYSVRGTACVSPFSAYEILLRKKKELGRISEVYRFFICSQFTAF